MAHHFNHTDMEPRPTGFAGLMFLSISWMFTYLQSLDRSDISFMLSTIATLMAIIYYLLQIRKISKK